MSEEEICKDIMQKLRETGQIYIVDLDYPISITKYLFRLLDAMRRTRAERIDIPEVQYDFEAYIYDLLGFPRSTDRSTMRKLNVGRVSDPTIQFLVRR